MKSYYTLIPEKVYADIDRLDESFKQLSIHGYKLSNLMEIISIVACHTRKDVKTSQLQMTYINKLVPSGQHYMKGLLELGIIERSDFYTPGSASFQYRFSDDYQSKYLSFPLKDNKLIYRIENAQAGLRKKTSGSIRGVSEQTKYLKQLSIDPGYYSFIEATYTDDVERFNAYQASATRIINQDFFYSVDSTSGRFHSNLSNMPKDLRPFARIQGESLVNLDIKNSQPYLSTKILTDPGSIAFLAKDPALAMLLKELKVPHKQDIENYISLAVSGQIYEFMMQKCLDEGIELSRDQAKTHMLRILFARNRMPKDELNRNVRQIFINNFPSVQQLFSRVRGHIKGDKFRGFQRFAILLQTIESYLILSVILKRIYKELPGTIAVTVHDSIMTGILTNKVDEVKGIMVDELTRFVGYEPIISVEKYSEKETKKEEGEVMEGV